MVPEGTTKLCKIFLTSVKFKIRRMPEKTIKKQKNSLTQFTHLQITPSLTLSGSLCYYSLFISIYILYIINILQYISYSMLIVSLYSMRTTVFTVWDYHSLATSFFLRQVYHVESILYGVTHYSTYQYASQHSCRICITFVVNNNNIHCLVYIQF